MALKTDKKMGLRQKVEDLFRDVALREKHDNFLSLLKAEAIPDAEPIAAFFRKNIEDSILDTVQQISDIQYFRMETSGDWGDYGRRKVIWGYARLLLNIMPEAEVTESDIRAFQTLIYRKQELFKLSGERLRKLEDSLRFTIMGQEIAASRADIINDYLRFVGSPNRVSIGMHGKYRSMIYGIAEILRVENHLIYLFDKELWRTPSNIMSIAAIVDQGDMAIRKESCRAIFEMKWKKMVQYSEYEHDPSINAEAQTIGRILKKRALQAYHVSSVKETDKIKDLFIAEMVEGIVWHKLGHGVFCNDELTVEQAGLSKACEYFGKNIVSVLHEILADWANKAETLKGPIKHFIDIAKQGDIDKANRMILVYMSDNWFLSSKKEMLENQTDLMIGILCSFINHNRRIRFDLMDTMFDELHKFIFDTSIEILEKIKHVAVSATYIITGSPYPFDFIRDQVEKHIAASHPDADRESMFYKTAFWNDVFMLMEKMAKTDFAEVKRILADKEVEFKQVLLRLLDPENASIYRDNMRDYLLYQMKVKGFGVSSSLIDYRLPFAAQPAAMVANQTLM
jgi:hypothetical protein